MTKSDKATWQDHTTIKSRRQGIALSGLQTLVSPAPHLLRYA